jgi:hypothetical protein
MRLLGKVRGDGALTIDRFSECSPADGTMAAVEKSGLRHVRLAARERRYRISPAFGSGALGMGAHYGLPCPSRHRNNRQVGRGPSGVSRSMLRTVQHRTGSTILDDEVLVDVAPYSRPGRMEIGGMSGGRSLFGILGASVLAIGAAGAQQIELPAGPNRDVVSHECQACHDLGMVVAAAGMSREGWNSTIDEMISYGMRVDSEGRAKILDYLSTSLGPKPAANSTGR